MPFDGFLFFKPKTDQEGFREQVIQRLDQALKDAREGRNITTFINLPEPKDHTRDYDSAIHMLEMCVDDTIEIDADDFDRYVMDNWGWKERFSETTSNYLGRK